jgi:hypothetical protein
MHTPSRARERTIRRLLLLMAAAWVATAGVAMAQTACTLDRAPAATLLLPYFQVDVVHDGGLTTLLAIGTVSSRASVASVTLWTDLGVPTLHFNVFLTGYDVQTINLRDVLAGRLPITAAQGQDPADTISPRGYFSEDIALAECAGLLPPPPLTATLASQVRAAHTGGFAQFLAGCSAQAFDDGMARGYVTVDMVRTCTVKIPGDAGYFVAGGQGLALDDNLLWGDFILVDPSGNTAIGEPLVRVQAFPSRFAGGNTTFYGRLLGWSAADDREPLAVSWAARFIQQGAFSGGTDFLVWSDPGAPSAPFVCGGKPAWYPQPVQDFTFDEEEHIERVGSCPLATCPPTQVPTPFPAVSNRVSVASAPLRPNWAGIPLPTSFDFGWAYFRFYDPQHPASDHSQAWVGQVMTSSGHYAVEMAGTPLDSACAPAPWPYLN